MWTFTIFLYKVKKNIININLPIEHANLNSNANTLFANLSDWTNIRISNLTDRILHLNYISITSLILEKKKLYIANFKTA